MPGLRPPGEIPGCAGQVLLTSDSGSADPEIYAVVLWHTWEIGNGWGRFPSPLTAMYVLDRILDDVHFTFDQGDALADESAGTRLSEETRRRLLEALPGLVEFVSTFSEVIDLDFSRTQSVREGRGFLAFGPVRATDRRDVVDVLFHAGPLWSRVNHYELIERDGEWVVENYRTDIIS